MNALPHDFHIAPWQFAGRPDFTHGIQAVFFDCEGVIVKSQPSAFERGPLIVPGAREYLETHFGRYDSFLVSDVDQACLDGICSQHKLSHFFRQIAGGPRKRIRWINQLTGAFHIDPQRAVYVGNSADHYRVAKQAGLHFIGVGSGLNAHHNEGVPVIQDLHALDQALASLPVLKEVTCPV